MNDVSKAIDVIGGCLAGVVACKGFYVSFGLVLPYVVAIVSITPVIATLIELKKEEMKEEEGEGN